ncbi:menaquinone biosynthetic enzyme MqnA/MqnD family protein [Rubripirellula reticaptiva]|uniref:Chorismate dehydratase n=1 Tax=Rubripirellula reticaptiva TaxID=2528013 RepID=A0A5C6F7Z2_9BACT|nr:menaquinone biosynthesis protein [Rubripirellula reticaptiva]TWU56216.1 Chorismate dehydratase [Rubripirellula reticaptiva]
MLRLGAVSYLNTKPLIHTLAEQLGSKGTLSVDLPSRLASDLAAGRLDVALIPSVEYFRGQGYQIVSDAAIGCRGPVWSVRLLSRVPVPEIRTLALDEGSRTSAAMVQVLLHEMHGLRPSTVPMEIDQTVDDVDADAILMIGDRAMHPASGVYHEIWDLGDRWCRWTELPFVFAMWVARPGVEVTGLSEILESSRDVGIEHFESIAAAHAATHGLTKEDLHRYFAENLHFQLGPGERRGLESFRQRATAIGLVPDLNVTTTAYKRSLGSDNDHDLH